MRSAIAPFAVLVLAACSGVVGHTNAPVPVDAGGAARMGEGVGGSSGSSNSGGNDSEMDSGRPPSTTGTSGSGSSSGSGSASGSGSSSGTGSDGGSRTIGSGDVGVPVIPQVMGTCPQIATGTVTVSGQQVQIWAGTKSSKPAPILFYWHGAGSNSNEAQMLMGPQISEITAEGGVVASFTTSTGMGMNTGDAVWYTGDYAMADQILACAMIQLNIDAWEIYTAGCSAGGLQAATMVFSRSEYLAAAMPNSGGIFGNVFMFQDAHVPSLITTHGNDSGGGIIISFAQASAAADMAVATAASGSSPPGGYVVDCNNGGNHCGAPAVDIAAQWQFCKDHPFGVAPDPYAGGLPSSFPSYCSVVTSQRDASVSD